MKLLLKLIHKDFKRNRAITAALGILMTLSVLLMAGGLRTAVTILSSVNELNERAMPPHYLQMHKGSYDEKSFEDFVAAHDYIEDAQIVEMLNISNANIIYQGETLQKYLMDNGFVVQNERFDLLLNRANEKAVVREGEIGVPVYYFEELGIEIGDVITLKAGDYRKDLSVSTFIRDAQMNAALTSSKRFLISQADLDEISANMGEWEYCFEFLLKEGTETSALEKDYMDEGMPSNGVAITGSLLLMINAISHGLAAFIIIIISMLLVMIAVLCLSYTIRVTMLEEKYTIGEMKAIGFSGKVIKRIYQIKYILLMLAADLIGYLTAIPLGKFFSSSVMIYYGNAGDKWMQWIVPLIGIIGLNLVVIVKCQSIIGKCLKSSVVELMRGGGRIKKEGRYSLPFAGLTYPNLIVAWGELKCKWQEYGLLFFVFVFASFLVVLPLNMRHTIKNPSFMTYMGVGASDIRIDLQYGQKLREQKEALETYLKNDPQIEKYAMYRYGNVQIKNRDGKKEYMRVENGDQSVFPLEYLKGKAPSDSKQIALSYLNALGLGKEVGDLIMVSYRGEELLFTVSGIYQDITYGGKTAKAAIHFDETDVEVYIIYLDVKEGVSIQAKTEELRNISNEAKVTPIGEFVSQTLGGIIDNMVLVEGTALTISLLLIILITAMVLQLITAREHSMIAIKKAIGFSNRAIRLQLGIRIVIVQAAAIITGVILASTLGEVIFGWMLSAMGASKIKMLVEPITAYLLYPAMQLLAALMTVIEATKGVRSYHIRDQIME